MSIIFAADRVHEPLYCVVPFFDPWRWKSTVKNLQRTLKHLHDSGAVIILVEAGFNRRDLVFADSGLDGTFADCGIMDKRYQHKYIGLHTKDELWLKENLGNIGFQHAPYDWQNGCMLDGDIHFVRPNWVGECIQKLQHGTNSEMAWCQMFSHARDVGPNYELLDEDYPHANGVSFVHAWKKGAIKTTITPQIQADLDALGGDDITRIGIDFEKLKSDLGGGYQPEPRVFPGLAWAHTRKAYEAVGGYIDIAVWGGADHHQAYALIGKTEGMMLDSLHPNYKSIINEWYERATKHIRRNVVLMEGSILHSWHGKKIGRGYGKKHLLLAKFKFDPLRHLKKDSQGLWQLHDDGSESYVQIRDTMRSVAKERNEDSNEIGVWSKPQGH